MSPTLFERYGAKLASRGRMMFSQVRKYPQGEGECEVGLRGEGESAVSPRCVCLCARDITHDLPVVSVYCHRVRFMGACYNIIGSI